jgi:hypothetical protein
MTHTHMTNSTTTKRNPFPLRSNFMAEGRKWRVVGFGMYNWQSGLFFARPVCEDGKMEFGGERGFTSEHMVRVR